MPRYLLHCIISTKIKVVLQRFEVCGIFNRNFFCEFSSDLIWMCPWNSF